MSRGGRDMVCHQKPHLQHSDSGSEGISQIQSSPWRARGLCSTSRKLILETCNRETSPQYIWLWRPMSFMSSGPKGMEGTELLLLKGLHIDSLTPGTSAEAEVWKASRLYVKEIYLQIFMSARGLGACWDLLWGRRHWNGPFFHSPSTLILLAGTSHPCTFPLPGKNQWTLPGPVLSHHPTTSWRCALVLCSPAALLKLVGTHSPHRGGSLIIWLWWLGSFCSWVPRDCNNWRDSSWQATTPRALHKQQTETHLQSFCEKSLSTYLGASAYGADFRYATHVEGTEGLSGNVGQGTPYLHSPSASLELASTSQKGVDTLIWNPNFCNCCPKVTSRLPGLEENRVYNHDPMGLYIFAHFKSSCLRARLPNSLKLGTVIPTFGILTGLGTPPSKTETSQE